MLPAFLLSRKQKSLEYFFTLIRLHLEEKLSLEQIWARHDTEGRFGSIKTLYRYHRQLASQLDNILTILCREAVMIQNCIVLPEIRPGESSTREKLRILFSLLDTLVDLLHQKHRSGILLQKERHAFLHYYLFRSADILLLDSS